MRFRPQIIVQHAVSGMRSLPLEGNVRWTLCIEAGYLGRV